MFLTHVFVKHGSILWIMTRKIYCSFVLFTSIYYINWFNGPNKQQHLPVHLRPLPIHPGAQLHLKLPAVLVQVACLSQLWAPISHSLISVKEGTNKKPCKEKLMLFWWSDDLGLNSVRFLALSSELKLGLNCLKTAAGDDRTKSFWLTVFIQGELHFRAEGSKTFSWSLILIAFLQRFNEQTQSLDFHCASLSRVIKKAKRENDILMLWPCSVCSVWTSLRLF